MTPVLTLTRPLETPVRCSAASVKNNRCMGGSQSGLAVLRTVLLFQLGTVQKIWPPGRRSCWALARN
jgi:hypothetical protein